MISGPMPSPGSVTMRCAMRPQRYRAAGAATASRSGWSAEAQLERAGIGASVRTRCSRAESRPWRSRARRCGSSAERRARFWRRSASSAACRCARTSGGALTVRDTRQRSRRGRRPSARGSRPRAQHGALRCDEVALQRGAVGRAGRRSASGACPRCRRSPGAQDGGDRIGLLEGAFAGERPGERGAEAGWQRWCATATERAMRSGHQILPGSAATLNPRRGRSCRDARGRLLVRAPAGSQRGRDRPAALALALVARRSAAPGRA